MFKIHNSNVSFEEEIQKLISTSGYSTNDLFITVAGNKCKTKEAFYTEMKTKLNFSSFFADNWDSFSDCVFEFLMLQQKNILIYFSETKLLLSENENDLTVFRAVLEELAQNGYKNEIRFTFSQ